MKTQPLSPQTRRRLERLFSVNDRPAAETLLVEECGNNLQFCEELDMYQLERFRFAALKISQGSIEVLLSTVLLAQQDYRDLLMGAGFGEDVTEHERWLPDVKAG